MTEIVSVRKALDYEKDLSEAINKTLNDLGGIERFVKKGDRVALKPNLLVFSSPSKAIVTHPIFVLEVFKKVLQAGGDPFVIDSPGSGIPFTKTSLNSLYRLTGYSDAFKDYSDCLNTDTSKVTVEIENGLILKRVDILKPLMEADVIINLPKMKTHTLTFLSGAVKNMYGSVPGMEKTRYHSRFRDVHDFSKALLDVWNITKPDLTIMDGVVSLEGDGPAMRGIPRKTEIVLSSEDSLLMDLAICKLIGLSYEDIPYLKVALENNLSDGRYSLVGDIPTINDFILPRTYHGKLSIDPISLYNYMVFPIFSKFLIEKPKVIKQKCIRCGVCVRSCPERAITMDKISAKIEYDKCIRCYCCHEQCPEGAIDLKRINI
ncbi:MAG: F420-reducing hydrogenase, subunit gamma [Candidatus Methanofastidiosum methylothiophilum]|uniref:F420-reducing hydrogenase, subunit gamma n=1 Tax=Candidatus Methanofastidiosum methylothiophilum TaxID=1705564 RepID=A0A150ITF5_9EURY|nr:MAG: F420-reducing hydrogenase, subunit gamma [Candidatus Methanofastidiosum methylthiophilus]KYC48301.1 MAG: F420-reducing hydrogenase, subunit gamma [Candidatus Methanofastidiosum methylthiophilus]KYC50970.1 MAG: F420-reducing hydrogenase, subunit gamma [Candidatus Methanofastidiosum methylthiophilus]